MNWAGAIVGPIALAAVLVAGRSLASPAGPPEVASSPQAKIDYILKCQGCHRPDGDGTAVTTPPLKDTVARFLAVPGGREFLARVPGVATADLDDRRLADLLNWTLYRFDAAHVPPGFKQYTAAEIGELRKTPLRLERAAIRERLMAEIGEKTPH